LPGGGAVILLQPLFFKFTGAESRSISSPRWDWNRFGRYASGVVELIGRSLLLFQCYAWLGALLGDRRHGRRDASHLTVLGISVQNDGGCYFAWRSPCSFAAWSFCSFIGANSNRIAFDSITFMNFASTQTDRPLN